MGTKDADTSRLALLRLLNQEPTLSQRDLPRALGLSLGKTHYELHALLGKGLVKVRDFGRSDRKPALSCLLTPAGVREEIRLTHVFLERYEAEFARLREAVVQLRGEIDADSADAIKP